MKIKYFSEYSPLVEDLTEDDDEKETECDPLHSTPATASDETSPWTAPRTLSASCCSSPPAPSAWRPPPPRSHRQTQDIPHHPDDQDQANPSIAHTLHSVSAEPSNESENKQNKQKKKFKNEWFFLYLVQAVALGFLYCKIF